MAAIMVYKQATGIKKVQTVTAFCTGRDVCAAIKFLIFEISMQSMTEILPAVVH